jgi:hypothetical protein
MENGFMYNVTATEALGHRIYNMVSEQRPVGKVHRKNIITGQSGMLFLFKTPLMFGWTIMDICRKKPTPINQEP